MKHLIFMVSLAALGMTGFAEEVDPDMEVFGGYIRKPGTAKGLVVFLNAQKRVASSELKSAFDEIDFSIKAPYVCKDVAKVSLPNPKADVVAAGGNVGVLLVDVAQYPALTVAPEEGWALVNVAALAADKPKAATLASRLRKELLRGFALAGGCSFMARGAIVLRNTVRTVPDLDAIRSESYGVDVINGFSRGLPRLGVRTWTVETYEDACQQGWAPAPTNKYQKAIWDEVHKLPTKPIKIVPPNQKK